MKITVLKSKIHKAIVSQARVDYNGSITIPAKLMREAHLYEYEQVHVNNATNGNRMITYVLEGEEDQSGVFINGAASHLFKEGDVVHILSYGEIEERHVHQHIPIII